MLEYLKMWLGKGNRSPRLESSIERWRRQIGPDARISDESRSRILGSVCDDVEPARGSLVPLFVSSRQWALAAVTPVLVLTLVLGYLGLSGTAPGSGDATVRVSKQGGDVVFLIANGQRGHRVYRSTSPDGQDSWKAYTTTTGSFRDRLHSEADLVFYRID